METLKLNPPMPLMDTLRNRKTMLSTAELMDMLSFNRATVCSWCRKGKIPHFRMPDQSYMFDPIQIATWLMQRFCG